MNVDKKRIMAASRTKSRQAQRRRDMLNLQKRKRLERLDMAKKLVAQSQKDTVLESDKSVETIPMSNPMSMPVGFGGNKQKKSSPKKGAKKSQSAYSRERRQYSNQLQISEWMIQTPDDLNGADLNDSRGFYVFPRPEGKQCFVIAVDGATYSRSRDGRVLQRFPSSLPGGCRNSRNNGNPNKKGQNYTILDCVWNATNSTFYVMDIMCWGGYSLYDCNCDFRLFWAYQKLSEVDCSLTTRLNKFSIIPTPFFECNPLGLQMAYENDFGFKKDGLLFVVKSGHYEPGLHPLSLRWKDAHTSEWPIDTEFDGSIPERQTIILRVSDSGELKTEEGFSVGSITTEFVEEHGIKPNHILRFKIGGAHHDEHGNPIIEDPQFLSICYKRYFVDSWSKIFFQEMMRHSPLTISDIAEVCSSPPAMVEIEGGECSPVPLHIPSLSPVTDAIGDGLPADVSSIVFNGHNSNIRVSDFDVLAGSDMS
eukprot:TRINITY_DN331186_c0_g1_i1.p1 TRINITY_DN331186_c0_g1~~TRINITY_DN331186_c0_g1_i1.p1  ORF type:complete len:479 (-),score=119.57 TRINITY_DN331186_c0_g1_i1:55-1491(-)